MEEHYPFSKITCVTQGFHRRAGRLFWASVLFAFATALALGLLWLSANLPQLLQEVIHALADSENPKHIASARRFYEVEVQDAILLLLPVMWSCVGIAVLFGGWLIYSGLRGETRVQLTLFGIHRTLAVRGHDPALLEFGEKVSQQLH